MSNQKHAEGKRAHQALIRNAIAASEGSTAGGLAEATKVTEKVLAVYGYTTASANLLLADVQMPPEFRGFIDAVVGVAGNRTEWFPASDKEIARHAGRSTKWVQMWRADLTAWQITNKITFIEMEDHYMDAEGEKHPHKYRVHFSRLVAECALDARVSNEWQRSPDAAIEQSARTLRDSLPTMPPRKLHRNGSGKPNAATLITRKLNHAATLIERALEIEEGTGNQVEISPEIITTLRRHIETLTKVVEKFSTTLAK